MVAVQERNGSKVVTVERPHVGIESKERPEAVSAGEDSRVRYLWGLLRLSFGWVFLWAFFDKLFGLGYATAAEDAWLEGGSPTFGFLNFATKGPFAEFYQGIAGNAVVDWMFMLGLLGIGAALILGIGARIAGYSSIVILLAMFSAVILPEHNPVLDEHVIYAITLGALTLVRAGYPLGPGKYWARVPWVKRYPVLE